MPVEQPETHESEYRGLQYSLLDLFLYFLAFTLLISGYATVLTRGASENGCLFLMHVMPMIVGGFLYAIGSMTRARLHYKRFPPLTRYLLISSLLLSASFLCYLLWAFKRTVYGDFFPPRAWPYPDGVILELNNWYDARFPASPGTMKLHGEIPRVLFTLDILIGSAFPIVAAFLGLLVPFRPEWLRGLKSVCWPIPRR
jgi:hypothetical protein